MSFADTKARFLINRGDPCTIIRAAGNIQTTGRILAVKRKTDFFSINNLREGVFPVDSGVLHGDLVQNDVTGEQFFVTALQNKTVGGSQTSVDTEMYMVNAPDVQFQRFKVTADGNLNPSSKTWNAVLNAPANVAHVSGGEQRKDGLLLPTTVLVVTMQATPDTPIVLQDRAVIDGKKYQVDDIDLTKSPGLQVLQLSVDARK